MGSGLIPLNIELQQDDRTVSCGHNTVFGTPTHTPTSSLYIKIQSNCHLILHYNHHHHHIYMLRQPTCPPWNLSLGHCTGPGGHTTYYSLVSSCQTNYWSIHCPLTCFSLLCWHRARNIYWIGSLLYHYCPANYPVTSWGMILATLQFVTDQ